MSDSIAIIGAGPTGLGAAYRLQELGFTNYKIYEKNPYVGGLSASFKDEQGFTWDIGGHVIFSREPYFRNLINKLLPDGFFEHQRRSFIRLLNTWVPYPFQNNIRHLPKEAILECVSGLLEVYKQRPEFSNFDQWLLATFGEGMHRYFLSPDNKKRWAYPLDKMSYDWIAERVGVVDVMEVLKNIISEQDAVSWGPNNAFVFPKFGGTGALFAGFVPYIEEHLVLEKELVEIDTQQKLITFADGSSEFYGKLVNTMPVDELITRSDLFDRLSTEVGWLKHCSGLVVGIGLRRPLPRDWCWMYFPEENSPFYRVTYLSHYSPYNAPDENHYSLLCDISYSKYRQEDEDTIIQRSISGLLNVGLLTFEDIPYIVSRYLINVPYSYPIPTLKLDQALSTIQPALEERGVYSRGRFGAWRYEIGNMDHSVLQGKEIIDRLLLGEEEELYAQ